MRIHFTGVAGAGMSAAALMMRDAGHQVSGSDEDVFPPMSTYVEALGFPFARAFDPANLPPDLDLLVMGSSARLGGEANPEAQAARRRGVRVTSFSELLGEAVAGREPIVVAGSVGKSTCTALMAHVLRRSGRDPGWMIGAISPSLPATGHWGAAPEMVLEGDEYVVGLGDARSKFELYRPAHVLLTSVAHDHVNAFPTLGAYQAAFRALLGLVPDDGVAVLRDDPAVRAVAGDCRARVVWYGDAPCDGWWSHGVAYGETSRFTLMGPGGRKIPLSTSLLGAHNIDNIVGVCAFLLERKLAAEYALAEAVASFCGVRRRLDRLTHASQVPVIEGFGSSYEKARAAIEAIGLHYPRRPLVVVFEPHALTWRSRETLPWYDTVFQGAARVLMLPPASHGAEHHDQATHEEIIARAAATGLPVTPVANASDAMAQLSGLAGDEVVLLLSSGPVMGLADRLPALFEDRYARPRAVA